MAIKQFRKLLIGIESASVPGGAVAASTYLRMSGTLEDRREIRFVPEDVGYLSQVDRTYTNSFGALLAAETEANFEQLPYIFNMGINAASVSQDGASAGDYIRSYIMPTTAANVLNTYTIEAGDDAGAEETSYCFVESFTLSGAPQEALKLTANIVGRDVIPTSYTTPLALPSIEECLFQKCKLYTDDCSSANTIGTTPATNTFLGFTLNVTTGWHEIYTGDGSMYFSFIKCTDPEVTLEVTFEHDAKSIDEKVDWRAETARQIRILCQGSAFSPDTGTVYHYKTLIIDVAGKWEKFDKIGEQNGNDIVTGTLRGRYNAGADLFCEIVVVNALASLP